MTRQLSDFEATQPLAAKFFSHALSQNQLMHAYLLAGSDLPNSYQLALTLAQIINCNQKPDAINACGTCQNCRWIETNAHPGVLTVSNLTYLTNFDAETGISKSKTGKPQQQIVVDQLQNLLATLSLHSGGFQRVVILCGAEERSDITEAVVTAPKDWGAVDAGQWVPLALDRKLLADPLANKFLKTLEEPPHDVIFFLLTDSEEKLLETIVSRCQKIPMRASFNHTPWDITPETAQAFLPLLNTLGQPDYLNHVELFSAYLKENNISSETALRQFQAFLWQAFSANPEQFLQTKKQLNALERARRMIHDRTREDAVLEDCFLALSQ